MWIWVINIEFRANSTLLTSERSPPTNLAPPWGSPTSQHSALHLGGTLKSRITHRRHNNVRNMIKSRLWSSLFTLCCTMYRTVESTVFSDLSWEHARQVTQIVHCSPRLQMIPTALQVLIWGLQIHFSEWGHLQIQTSWIMKVRTTIMNNLVLLFSW